ncbi:MAG: hypothetical protein ACR2NZ_21925, partial [Rubripirellula sp.]
MSFRFPSRLASAPPPSVWRDGPTVGETEPYLQPFRSAQSEAPAKAFPFHALCSGGANLADAGGVPPIHFT